MVLTDVTVTDKHGNPVRGLTERDFQVFDNEKPQTPSSFEEHQERVARLEETGSGGDAEPGSFSNELLRHPPPQVNVLLFDTTTIGMVDQMVLFEQMQRFVAGLPPGQPVAVFTRYGDVTIQLCGFTDDHATLLAAIRKAIPRFQRPGAWMASEMDTLNQMSTYLSQIPGRKNLLWFTGGSNLLLKTDPTSLPGYQDMRPIYDVLEKERIAIDPIDARGLTVSSSMGMQFQQMQMRQDAASTGGEVFVNTNGLALAAEHIVATDGDYYTLSYAPQDLRTDGKWHRVEVKLDAKGYQLSYRHGYFDDGSNQKEPTGKTRTVLRVDGSKEEVPNDRSEPIIFRAQILPVAEEAAAAEAKNLRPKRGQAAYEVRYEVPVRDVHMETAQGNPEGTMVVGTVVLAFDHDGEPVAHRFQETKVGVNKELARRRPDAQFTIEQRVNLPLGRNYLYLAVWDTTTGRLGTVEATVKVRKLVAGSP
jgi:VWFA-related protein